LRAPGAAIPGFLAFCPGAAGKAFRGAEWILGKKTPSPGTGPTGKRLHGGRVVWGRKKKGCRGPPGGGGSFLGGGPGAGGSRGGRPGFCSGMGTGRGAGGRRIFPKKHGGGGGTSGPAAGAAGGNGRGGFRGHGLTGGQPASVWARKAGGVLGGGKKKRGGHRDFLFGRQGGGGPGGGGAGNWARGGGLFVFRGAEKPRKFGKNFFLVPPGGRAHKNKQKFWANEGAKLCISVPAGGPRALREGG